MLSTSLDDHGRPIGRVARANGGQDVAQLLLDASLVVPVDELLVEYAERAGAAAAAEARRGVDVLTRED